ncbi:MAG: SCO family protein [Candidatus Kariarchaeaceae archaeon]
MIDSDLLDIYNDNRRRKKISTIILVVIIGSLLVASAIPDDESPIVVKLNLPYYSEVTDFTLTNSDNESYTFSSDDGKIRVVNFFYTKCPGDEGCSLITLKLSQLFSEVRQHDYLDKIKFISIDFDYINDTVADVYEYANKYSSDTENWQFLIGNKTQIDNVTNDWKYYFAVNNVTTSLALKHGDEVHNPDPYDHTFVVYIVDQNSIIRKYLLGSSWDLDNAFESLEFLIDEYQNP